MPGTSWTQSKGELNGRPGTWYYETVQGEHPYRVRHFVADADLGVADTRNAQAGNPWELYPHVTEQE